MDSRTSGIPLNSVASKEVAVLHDNSPEFELSSSVLLCESSSQISNTVLGDGLLHFLFEEISIFSSDENEFSVYEFFSDQLLLD